MSGYGLEAWQYFFQPEEDRAKRESWKKQGKCFATPGLDDIFFPHPDDPNKRTKTNEAIAFCKGLHDIYPGDCPSREACLEYALEEKVWEGVYGGMSGRGRRKLATRRAKQQSSSESSKKTASSSPTSKRKSGESTKSATPPETPSTSTPARSAKQTGARAPRATASLAPQQKQKPLAGTSPSTKRGTTSTTGTSGRSGGSASSKGSSAVSRAGTSGGRRPRSSAPSAGAPSSPTSKSRSKTRRSD